MLNQMNKIIKVKSLTKRYGQTAIDLIKKEFSEI